MPSTETHTTRVHGTITQQWEVHCVDWGVQGGGPGRAGGGLPPAGMQPWGVGPEELIWGSLLSVEVEL